VVVAYQAAEPEARAMPRYPVARPFISLNREERASILHELSDCGAHGEWRLQ
jgi:hypothetical protein